MKYRDLRDFLAGLESRGELKRIAATVDPRLEMTEICDRVLKAGGPALLFEKPRGHTVPVLGNLFGTVKRVAASQFFEVRRSGLIAITLDKGDSLISAQFVHTGDDAVLVTAKGQSIRFAAKDVREMGRQAAGVRGMKMGSGDSIVGSGIVPKGVKDAELLVLSSTGYGKKTKLSEYKTQGRGGSGIKTM